jgi:predicted nucleic acid-binding protein
MGARPTRQRRAPQRLTVALVLLDTTVLIDVLRARPAAARVLALRSTGDIPVTSAINVEEIVRGLRAEEQPVADQLFDGLLILPIGRAEAETAGAWRRDLAAAGRSVHQADCLFAAAASQASARLATGNVEDFPMPDVVVEHWRVGH